jgi:hypothetical protein
VILCGALAWGLVATVRQGEQDALLVLQWMLDGADPDSGDPVEVIEGLNQEAGRAGRDPNASAERLELAGRAAQWAVDLARGAADLGREVDEPRYLDTLATVRYRLGNFDSAVDLAWQAVELESEPDLAAFHLSQAARFELALLRSGGVSLVGVGDAPLVRLERSAQGSGLVLASDGTSTGGLTAHGVAMRGATPLAHLRVDLPGPIERGAVIELPLDSAAADALEGFDEIVTTRIAPRSDEGVELRVVVQALDPEVFELT